MTSDAHTNNQTTALIGTFFIPQVGWSSWEWAPALDSSGKPAVIALDGSETTLRLSGSPVNGQPEVNVNFLMLVPATPEPKLTASISGGQVTISFPTQTGYSYQVQYKNNLTDATWQNLGAALPGTGATRSAQDAASLSNRFYRVQVQ